jgi:hypothetical protein
MSEDLLSEKEFRELKELSKWNYVKSLYKLIKNLKIQAEKNCELCEKQMLNPHDVNIDFLFEDWRSCAENCSECGIEERVNMCDLQFQLMNHIANALSEIRERQNALAKIVMKKDTVGSRILEKIEKKQHDEDKKASGL